MKIRNWHLFLVFGCIFAISISMIYMSSLGVVSTSTEDAEDSIVSDEPKSSWWIFTKTKTPSLTSTGVALQVGDIIMFPDDGGFISRIIPGGYSHSAVYVGDGKMVEAVENGVVMSSIPGSGSGKQVYRVSTTTSVKQAAANFAKTKIGLPYDFIWLTYIGGKQVNGNSYYCSELCWASYKAYGVDIDRNPGWSWTYGNNVAPQELVDDGETYRVGVL